MNLLPIANTNRHFSLRFVVDYEQNFGDRQTNFVAILMRSVRLFLKLIDNGDSKQNASIHCKLNIT